MRNHFLPARDNRAVNQLVLRSNNRGEKENKVFLEKETTNKHRVKAGKRIGRSDGIGRLIFYRDENDGSDHIL